MNLKEMREKLNALADKMSALSKKTDRTADEEAELDRIINEFNDLLPKAERLIAIDRAATRAKELNQSTGSVTEQVSDEERERLGKGPGEGTGQPDRRSIGQRFAESDQVKEWITSGGQAGTPSKKFNVGRRPVPGATHAPMQYDGSGPVNRMALIETGLFPSFMPAPQVLPNIVRPHDYALTMRQVIAGGRTTTDTIYFLRELLFTNLAAETAQATAFDPAALGSEGRKPQSSLTFEQASTAVKTIAHWVPITKQAIADVAQLQSYVEGRLLVGVERRLNSQIANGDGIGENLTGLLQTTGILDLDDAYYAALSPALPDAASVNAVFNRIIWAATVIEVASDAMATFVALHPYDLARMRMYTDANRQYLAGSPFVDAAIPTISGLPVAKDRDIPQGTALVGDGTAAMLFDREDANILIGWINDQFVRNMLTILAEMRAALAVFRPGGFAAVDITI